MTACPIRYQRQVSDRKGKIFYTSITSLSHISKLCGILANEKTPVFVAADENDAVRGYVFCQMKRQPFSTNMHDFKTLFIDDLCIDESCRGEHIGTKLFDYALAYAKAQGCYDLTLNVWEGNDSARAFYGKMGMFVKETQMEILVK